MVQFKSSICDLSHLNQGNKLPEREGGLRKWLFVLRWAVYKMTKACPESNHDWPLSEGCRKTRVPNRKASLSFSKQQATWRWAVNLMFIFWQHLTPQLNRANDSMLIRQAMPNHQHLQMLRCQTWYLGHQGNKQTICDSLCTRSNFACDIYKTDSKITLLYPLWALLGGSLNVLHRTAGCFPFSLR